MAAPDPIPVYIGDDMSLAFTYRESAENGGNGAPIDLTGCSIIGALYPPFVPTPVALTADDGLAGLIDGPNGKLGIGAWRSLTSDYAPSPNGGFLRVSIFDTRSHLKTVAVWPLHTLAGREVMPGPLINRVVTDPITGRTLTFDGPTDLFPGVVVLPLSIMGAPAEANAGEDYAFIPTVANSTGPVLFALSGDPLVDGLSFSTSTGAISGNATTGGVLTLTITVTDDVGTATLGPFTLTVNESNGLDLSTPLSSASQPHL